MAQFFCPKVQVTALSLVLAVMTGSLLLPIEQNISQQHTLFSHSQIQQFTYNRYQAGFACRENGWEFCEGWVYRRGRLA